MSETSVKNYEEEETDDCNNFILELNENKLTQKSFSDVPKQTSKIY